MGINWFEGGRRVFGLFSGILLLSSAAYIVFGGGDNRVILETNSPSDRLKWTLKECSYPEQVLDWKYSVWKRRNPDCGRLFSGERK